MKKIIHPIFIVLLLVFFKVSSVKADIEIKFGESYMCGDSFEIIFPDQPSTTSMISINSDPTYAYVLAEAGKREKILQIRIKIRNLTPIIYKDGLGGKSFKLTGYIRDRKFTYTPEFILSYDLSNITDASWFDYAPLRMKDLLLIYRINPLLINWEMNINPQASYKKTSYNYGTTTYYPLELTPCNGVFQFPSIRNSETGEIIKYERKTKTQL